MWVCVRRPSGNKRPSAFSYKSYSLLLWSSRVSQTLQRSRTLGGFHMGHTARIHEHTRADTGSDSQRPGQIRSFPPWRQRERSRVTYIHRSECSKKGMVFRNTRLSSFTRSHVVPNLHDLLSSEEDKGNVRVNVWEAVFHEWMVIYKAATDKKSIINIRGVTVHKHDVRYVPQFWCHSSVWGKINKTASFFTLSSGLLNKLLFL